MLQAGVKIYKYKDQFIHSKLILIDDDVASIGTVNLDYRSLDLHFEATALLYQDPSVTKLIKYYENDIENSEEILWITWQVRTWKQKVLESVIRIFSPLL
ncbi:Cardiolipin synthase [compost metagenome]